MSYHMYRAYSRIGHMVLVLGAAITSNPLVLCGRYYLHVGKTEAQRKLTFPAQGHEVNGK